jgi:hypothetical protein
MTYPRDSRLQCRDRLVRYCNRRYLAAEWRLDWHHADKWFQLLGHAERKYHGRCASYVTDPMCASK